MRKGCQVDANGGNTYLIDEAAQKVDIRITIMVFCTDCGQCIEIILSPNTLAHLSG